MTLKKSLNALNKIAETTATNEKVILLEKYLKQSEFLSVVHFALSKDRMYNIKKLPAFKRQGFIKTTTKDIFEFLNTLSGQTGSSDQDKHKLAQLASIDPETYEVVKRIVEKDLKCGANAKLINKARPGTINIVPYMRCSTSKKIDNIQYPAIVQEKVDGMFVNIMINEKGQMKILTRNGKKVWGLVTLRRIILDSIRNKKTFCNMVYTGELLILGKNGKYLPRKTGNGILNSCISNATIPAEADNVVFRCWDCLPLYKFYNGHDPEIFIHRFEKLKYFIKAVNNKKYVDIVRTTKVKSLTVARDFYRFIREKGGEGAVVKNTYGEWKDHTSPDCIKLKNIDDAELKVVGLNTGKPGSKYEKVLGALVCESRCGKLQVNVGSGFTDEERKLMPDHWLGKIITVEYDSVIDDKKKKTKSLYQPRFIEIRTDKNKADSLVEILNR